MEKPGLGNDFLLRIEDALKEISFNPELYAIIYKNIRRKLTRRFPFGVYYILENEKVVISGIINLLRHSRHWRKRFKE
jgi:hypothetical protein